MHSAKNTVYDLLYSLWISYLFPFLLLVILYFIFENSNSVDINFIILLIFNFLILSIIVIYYRSQYKKLLNYSIEVGYSHFKPSVKDVMLGFYGSIFSVVILLIIILFLISGDTLKLLTLSEMLFLSIIFASIYHFFSLYLVTKSKNKLIQTAMEPLDYSLMARIKEEIPGSSKINYFRYADIKPASLFLTAGVTKYKGRKNICLVSRYFQWKLSEDELFAVISHEVGHVQNRDLNINYLIFMLDFLLRAIYYTSFLLALKLVLFGPNTGYLIFEIFLIINLGVVMISSLLIRFILQYRSYNQEIKSDEYGASIVGNYAMANTLKKLPSVIPAPVNDDPLEFLGFRIAILKERGKNLNESLTTNLRTFSRFSNN